MKHFIKLLFLISLISGSCTRPKTDQILWHQEPLTIVKPESEGFSSERLTRIDSLFRGICDRA